MDLPKSVNRGGLPSVSVRDGNRLSISLRSLRTSAMSSLNDCRSESTLPFHCPNAKNSPCGHRQQRQESNPKQRAGEPFVHDSTPFGNG